MMNRNERRSRFERRSEERRTERVVKSLESVRDAVDEALSGATWRTTNGWWTGWR